jgi:ribulose-5-phosphate 4-epimerase/fuculose-1-phosphate aldolase
LTAYALQGKSIKAETGGAFALMKGEVPCIPFGMPGTTEIADGLAEKIANKNACLLGNHGVVCVSEDLDECAAFLEVLEDTVKIYTIANLIGRACPIPSDAWEALISQF